MDRLMLVIDNMKVWTPFNGFMMNFFKNDDIDQLMQLVFTNIKTQVEKPRMPESGFTFYQITQQLYINMW